MLFEWQIRQQKGAEKNIVEVGEGAGVDVIE
jgi:hypothetical protein